MKNCTVTDIERWTIAQKEELSTWNRINNNKGYINRLAKQLISFEKFFISVRYREFSIGDDWNYWWMKKFDKYKDLPRFVDSAIEVGCGPYTNIRVISKIIKIKNITCMDPLIRNYIKYKGTWLCKMHKKGLINISSCKCENISITDNSYDLTICINVLDHVENAVKCMSEILRITKKEGWIILGQDLSDNQDIENTKHDIMHPIKLKYSDVEQNIINKCKTKYLRILSRKEGRNPKAHYATILYIGQKDEK